MKIPESKWNWFGCAGHLIVGKDCRFHLFTKVGKFVVSTVGEYLPSESVREILAKSRGVKIEGRGDARENDYMRKIGYEKIGFDRLYETMVFDAGKPCRLKTCMCGAPEIDGSEKDFRGYNTAGEATKGHFEMCLKWSKQ